MKNKILFNKFDLIKKQVKTKIEEVGDDLKTFTFKIPVKGDISSFNFIKNYPVNAADFIFEYDIEALDFSILPSIELSIIEIEITSKNPVLALNQLLRTLFNELSSDYCEEHGYSGWNLDCEILGSCKNKDILIDIKNYNALNYEIEKQ